MPDRFDELEARVDKLIRYIELIDSSLRDLKEQIEIRQELDKVENIVLRLARSLKCRKTK
jgi:transcriptional accessory protein Tex/SPT6